jgi:ECF sigma factor
MRKKEAKTVTPTEERATGPVPTGFEPITDPSDRQALDYLFSATYEELRRLASAVRRYDPSATLNPTALANEAWIKMAKSPEIAVSSQLHFKRIAARAMRQILVEAARRRSAASRRHFRPTT